MKLLNLILSSISTGLFVAAAAPPDSHQLTQQNLAEWCDLIQPSDEERSFLEIPWRQSLREGIIDAQIKGKPILLWAMNGHPIGCV